MEGVSSIFGHFGHNEIVIKHADAGLGDSAIHPLRCRPLWGVQGGRAPLGEPCRAIQREREGESRETQRGQRGAGRGSLVAGGQHGTGQGCGARGGLLEGRGGHGATGTLVGMVVAA